MLQWKAGAVHHLPNALSRPPHVSTPQPNVDKPFPDTFTSATRAVYVGPNGPVLEGVPLSDVGEEKEQNGSSTASLAALDSAFAPVIQLLPSTRANAGQPLYDM